MTRPPPKSPLFPYTTLFRSADTMVVDAWGAGVREVEGRTLAEVLQSVSGGDPEAERRDPKVKSHDHDSVAEGAASERLLKGIRSRMPEPVPEEPDHDVWTLARAGWPV